MIFSRTHSYGHTPEQKRRKPGANWGSFQGLSSSWSGTPVYYTNHSIVSDPDEALHIVTGVQEEIPYCSPGTSSGKQKKARSTNKPRFCSANTAATVETYQILLVLQKLSNKSISANLNFQEQHEQNSNTASTPQPNNAQLRWKNQKNFELFDDLVKTILRNHN